MCHIRWMLHLNRHTLVVCAYAEWLCSVSCSIFIDETRNSCGQIQCYTQSYTLTITCITSITVSIISLVCTVTLPSTGDPLNRAPTMRDLLERVATKAMDKWDMVGLVLNIDQHQLNTITHQNPVRCYSVMFYLWEKKADPPFTWATIVDALRSPIVGETKLASDIERWLNGDQ